MNKSIESLHKENTPKLPKFKAGDTIRLYLKIKEKNKERVQQFQGVVIQRKGQTDADKTFTVRKVSNGIGVERIFPIHLPSIQKIEVIREGIVRRAKLFYLRGKKGKAAKIKHREGRRKKSTTKSSSKKTTPTPKDTTKEGAPSTQK